MNEPNTIKDSAIGKPKLSLAPSNPIPAGPPIPVNDTISPKDIIGSVLRNKKLIAGIVLVSLILTLLLLSIISPRYTADALIMIESRDANIVGVPQAVADPTISEETIESEIEVIRSRGMAGKVIKLLHLENNPELNTSLDSSEEISGGFDPDRYLPDLTPTEADQDSHPLNRTEASQAVHLVNNFQKGLSVFRKGLSRVIQVNYSAKDPVIARNITNTIADQYIQQQREMKFRETEKAAEWLDERITPLRKKVEESETAVENFRINSGLLQSGGITLTSQQMAELNNQLIQADMKYAETSARLLQVNQLIKSPQGAGAVSEVIGSSLIQNLRSKEAELQQKIGEMSAEYGDLHPTMIQLRSEMRDLSNNIKREIKNIARGLKNEAAIAETQRISAQLKLNELKEQVAKSNKATVELRALEREAQANRALLETFLSKLKETSTYEDIDVQQPNARILSRAILPVTASFPKKIPILALVFVASSIFAILFVMVRESMDHGLYTVGLVEEHTGFPSLGYIPAIKTRDATGKTPEAHLLKSPQSAFSGAVRTLYTSIQLSNPENPAKTILVTSTQQKEGKTTLVNVLAISRSLAGQKTIIIDTDLRMANANRAFHVKSSPGLVELLNGDVAIEEVIHTDADTGVDFLPAGSPVQNPADLLMSENMDTLLRILKEAYDLILFDSPPVLDAPDARILMSKVDATVFVAKWNHTKRQLIREALRHIAVPGNNIVGVLINMVDEKKQASYGYGGSNYAYGQLVRYQG